MIGVARSFWTLLVGVLLLMLGNGLQGTLLGVRGALEGMGAGALSWVMSAYFLGLLIGARVTPGMIRRVGHVRVFAALASLISAGFILYATLPNPWVWAGLRLVIGFCFCGVYVVAESWLNDRATNETRGQAMSLYMVVQMTGIVAAQGLLTLADPGGYALFALISVLVSVSVAPMLLSAAPAPAFELGKRMTLRRLYEVSPLGCVSTFLIGAVYAALFGMAAVYGAEAGLSIGQISAFVAAIFAGGLVAQFPVGWLSDRIDRRLLIVALSLFAAAAATAGALFGAAAGPGALIAAAAAIGLAVNPLYSVVIAYVNDFLEPADMAAASGGLLFLNGLGAVGGPLAVGALMQALGPGGFFLYLAATLGAIGLYGLYRMSVRPTPASGGWAPISPSATRIAVETAQEAAATEPEPARV